MDGNGAKRGPEGQFPGDCVVPECDPLIFARVRGYLFENEDKEYIDVKEMADHLQNTYHDFQSKRRGPFRAMVRMAYKEITDNLARQACARWQCDDDTDIEIDAVAVEYSQGSKSYGRMDRANGNSADNVLIDISSDDEVTTCTTGHNKPEEMETTQISKRPHLSPSVEIRVQTSNQQVQEHQLETRSQFFNKAEKSRKRLRDKSNENISENYIRRKKNRDVPVIKSKIKFSDMGGITKVLEAVANLLIHMKHPEVYSQLGISPPRGFLLHGPSGCGKTSLAHAIAGELDVPLLKVSVPELVSGLLGESELRIRDLFDQAVAIAPCILFLDEIDAISADRITIAQKKMDRSISQLLFCLDELAQKTKGNKVLVVGATNRPDSVNPALRVAGRFDRDISLGIPDKEARAAILEVYTTGVTLSPDIDLHKIASLTPGFVGADLVALVRKAAMTAVNRIFQDLKKSPSVNVEVYEIINELPNSPSEIAVINAEPEKEPVVNTESENPEIIIEDIEDDPHVVQIDSTEKPEEQKDVSSETASAATAEKETEKASEDTPNTSQPAESPSTEPMAMAASPPAIIVEEPQDEQAVPTETAVAPDSSPKEDEQPAAVEAPEEVIIDSEHMQMQVEEEKKTDCKERLADLLAWLQTDSPLTSEQLALLRIEESDFENALKNFQTLAEREGFATVPSVTWDDVGSLQDIRQELQMIILAPLKYAERFDSLGINAPAGVLLYGPPGCGKTLLAKAIANEAGISFISIKGSDLLSTEVGDSEKAVSTCFSRARNSAPCIVFFDELDVLCARRAEGDSIVNSPVVNRVIKEVDGIKGRKDIFLVAASNRPENIDPSVLRPGRFDKTLYVGLPNALGRVDIIRALTKNGTKPQLAKDIRLEEIAEKSKGYTAADLAIVVREACIENLRETMAGLITPAEISLSHLHTAFEKVRPSLQEKDLRYYGKLQKIFSARGNQNVDIPMSLDPPLDTIMEAMET